MKTARCKKSFSFLWANPSTCQAQNVERTLYKGMSTSIKSQVLLLVSMERHSQTQRVPSSRERPNARVSNSTAWPLRAAAESDCRAATHMDKHSEFLKEDWSPQKERHQKERLGDVKSQVTWTHLAKDLVHHRHTSSRMLAGGWNALGSQEACALS